MITRASVTNTTFAMRHWSRDTQFKEQQLFLV
jgi:hypothetical protein